MADTNTLSKADLFDIAIVIGVALAVIALLALLGLLAERNTELQLDYNSSVVECVKAGAEPLECRTALLKGSDEL